MDIANELRENVHRSGLIAALPVMMGYFPLAFAFGMLAVENGMSVGQATSMSAFVYAGASQFVAVGMFGTGLNPAAIIIATLALNSRHLLMAASLSQRIGKLHFGRLLLLGSYVTDETFAVSSSGTKLDFHWLFSLQIGAYLSWVAGTVAGAVASSQLGDPVAYGFDFALVAMFIALLGAQVTSFTSGIVAIVAALLFRLLLMVIAPHWALSLAAIAAAGLGTLWDGRRSLSTGREGDAM